MPVSPPAQKWPRSFESAFNEPFVNNRLLGDVGQFPSGGLKFMQIVVCWLSCSTVRRDGGRGGDRMAAIFLSRSRIHSSSLCH
jgi:hypothetical protein